MPSRLALLTVAGVLAALAGGCAGAPTALTPEQIPTTFIGLVSAPNRTMHMEWTGTSGMAGRGAATTPFSASFDLAGDDFAGRITTQMNFDVEEQGGQSSTTEMALVGGQAYSRTPFSGGWQRLQNGDMPIGVDPLRKLELDDIQYVGSETRDGTDVHHVRVLNVANVAAGLFGGLINGLGTVSFDPASSSFDVYVDADAKPVSARLQLTTDADPDEFGTINLTSSYAFTNWGAEIYIVAPVVAPNGGGGDVGVPQPMP